MGCGSSHSLPVTPEGGESRGQSQPLSPINGRRLSLPGDALLGDGGEGGNEERDEEARISENDWMNDSQGDKERSYDYDSKEEKPTADTQQVNGILTNRLALNEVTSPRSSSGRSKNLAFEVSALDEGGDSLIKRHPPRKFHKLEEQQGEPNITQETLEEKQAIAEQRRKEILNKRVKSAKTASAKSVQARARVAESKEVDQAGDEPIESAKVVHAEGGI